MMRLRLPTIRVLFILAFLLQATPVLPRSWMVDAEGMHSVPFPTGAMSLAEITQADLDLDAVQESLSLVDGHLAIMENGLPIWESPASWSVRRASFTDLNHDGVSEVTLLAWRAFQPWPVDQFLPHGGRIDTFHDDEGNSCHIILIGLIRGVIDELWAGSALAQPVIAFRSADINNDGEEELVTLEGLYSRSGATPATELKAWEWNGFGFSVVSHIEGQFSDLALVQVPDGRILVLTP